MLKPKIDVFGFKKGTDLMDRRTINEEYARIGAELIETEAELIDIANSQATIVYLSSRQCKKKDGALVYGLCEKVPDKYKWGIPADYTITLFDRNIADFTEEQLRILIFHELLHIKIEFREDGTEIYGLNPHDLSDFKTIVNKFGTDWSDTDGHSED